MEGLDRKITELQDRIDRLVQTQIGFQKEIGALRAELTHLEEAQELTGTDPSIKESYFRVVFIKWYGSAALIDVNNIHKKLSRTNP